MVKVKKIAKWAIVVCVLALIAGLAYSTSSLFPKSGVAKTTPDQQKDPVEGAEDEIRPLREEAKALADSIFKLSSVEGLASYVMDPDRVRPLMEEYYQKHPLPGAMGTYAGLKATEYHVAAKRQFVVGKIAFEDQGPAMAVFEKTGGKMLLHWEVLVAYSKMEWDDFREQRPSQPTRFRVRMIPSNYYNFEFSGDPKLRSFTIMHPYSDRRINGYLRTDSPAFARYLNVASVARKIGLPVIADLSFPENPSGEDQVWIDELVQFSWVEGVDM